MIAKKFYQYVKTPHLYAYVNHIIEKNKDKCKAHVTWWEFDRSLQKRVSLNLDQEINVDMTTLDKTWHVVPDDTVEDKVWKSWRVQ